MEPAVEIRGLRKTFKGHLSIGRFLALDSVDLTVPAGVIYGFLGPNGAGKTTTLKILNGLLQPDSGSTTLLGRPAGDGEIRSRVGFLPEAPYFYDYLTGEELLGFFGQLFGIGHKELRDKVPQLLDTVGLKGKGGIQLRKYSKGMLQRIGLAQALLNDPALVILDEPMSGLDPIGRREIRDLILSMRARGQTVFFSSHILADAEMICDEVAILVRGKVVQQGPLEKLLGEEVQFWDVGVRNWGEIPAPFAGKILLRNEETVLLRVHDEGEVQRLIDAVRADKAAVLSVAPHKVSLEDLFLAHAPGRSA
jgi:ABC-2 type transport system ATP-binding protein